MCMLTSRACTHLAAVVAGWALVAELGVSSDAVARALLAEMASFARQAAGQCPDLALPRSANVAGVGGQVAGGIAAEQR
ncbi:MAG TPA: hypothetical protein VK162_02175 [Streptosporangiaceae bacterium]|nr:hypothetical protein [Streptosporangiaceae bacterium]